MWPRSLLRGLLEKKGQLIVLVAGSYLTPPSHVGAYVTAEISASSRKLPSQGQKFLGESHRTGIFPNDTNSYLNCLMKDLGENLRSQNQGGGGGGWNII